MLFYNAGISERKKRLNRLLETQSAFPASPHERLLKPVTTQLESSTFTVIVLRAPREGFSESIFKRLVHEYKSSESLYRHIQSGDFHKLI